MATTFDPRAAAGTAPLLHGKVAVITGAASGIGRAAVDLYRAAGARVAAADRDETALADLPDDVLTLRADVTSNEDVAAMAAAVEERHGRIDALLNSAGVGTIADAPQEVPETPDDVWDRTVGVNLSGTFRVCRAVVPVMARGGGGAIVNLASVLGLGGLVGAGAYSASKGGVIALTRTLALEGAPAGVRANVLAPGFIDTPMVRDYVPKLEDPEQALLDLQAAHPIGRMGIAEEVAAAALWLSSDAASFITGAVLPVDGGYGAV